MKKILATNSKKKRIIKEKPSTTKLGQELIEALIEAYLIELSRGK